MFSYGKQAQSPAHLTVLPRGKEIGKHMPLQVHSPLPVSPACRSQKVLKTITCCPMFSLVGLNLCILCLRLFPASNKVLRPEDGLGLGI